VKPTLKQTIETPENESTCGIVSKIHLLQKYCTPEQQLFLNKVATPCFYRKDDLVFHENFPAHNIYFVSSGFVALWKQTIFSKKQYIRFVREGELFGYRGSAIENPTYRLSASTFEDAIIYSILKKDFAIVLKENPELHFKIISRYVKELEKVETAFCYHITMNTREKVAEALLKIYTIFGGNNAPAPFKKAMLRKDIADIAGVSTGKTINMLSDFRSEKIVDTCGSEITFLNIDKIKEIVAAYH